MNAEDLELAEREGREAARNGEELVRNKYSMAQGSTTRLLAIAFRRGYRQEQSDMEIAEQEAAGHFKSKHGR